MFLCNAMCPANAFLFRALWPHMEHVIGVLAVCTNLKCRVRINLFFKYALQISHCSGSAFECCVSTWRLYADKFFSTLPHTSQVLCSAFKCTILMWLLSFLALIDFLHTAQSTIWWSHLEWLSSRLAVGKDLLHFGSVHSKGSFLKCSFLKCDIRELFRILLWHISHCTDSCTELLFEKVSTQAEEVLGSICKFLSLLRFFVDSLLASLSVLSIGSSFWEKLVHLEIKMMEFNLKKNVIRPFYIPPRWWYCLELERVGIILDTYFRLHPNTIWILHVWNASLVCLLL